MISGWPVFGVLLLLAAAAAVTGLLVAVATTASADCGAASGQTPTAGAQHRELAAGAGVVESSPPPRALEELDGSEKIGRAQAIEVPFGTGSEAVEISDGSLPSGLFQAATNEIKQIQSIQTVGRLQSRSASGSLQQNEKKREEGQMEIGPDTGQLPATFNKQAASNLSSNSSKYPAVYTNQFVIQVKGGESEARKLAQKHGFVYLNHILADYYHLEHRRLSKRSTSPHQDALNISIQEEPQVLLLERQVLKRRVKRDYLEFTSTPSSYPPTGGPDSQGHRQASPGTHHMHPILRPPNQPQQQQQRPSQQLLRPGSNVNRKPAPGAIQYTRPANQPRGPQPVLRLGAQAGARIGEHLEAAGRTQELLEAAASSGNLLYQHASAAAATAAGPNKQLGVARAQSQISTTTSTSTSTQSPVNNSASNSSHPFHHHQHQHQIKQSGNISNQMPFNDPSWPLMWYLDGGAKNGFDLNVMAAWKMGYTGKGIVITILDDGLEKDHPDLQANYDPLASFDINGDDADPMPRYDVNDSNRHGTRCAGEVAAVPDNNICSIGIAYNSKVGGVRMLDGDVTDAVEARSLGLNNQHIHIYSASWGPDDNGKTVDGPGEMATRAFIEGVTNGRQGLGSIFVFASGNGGREHDNCNCDGYTNSIWTLSISSATENGYVPWYIEACSSTLATTYSSGSYEERQIATTDLHHSCTSSHTGTSASAPLAAGICALVLESNPKLTWRDMQHIVVRTAKPANLVAKDWRTNALKRNVSHAFGYGLMDAAAMIIMAKHWTTVPIQYTCEVRSPPMDKFIPAKGYIELKLRAECANVRYLEHVQSKVTLTASRRGDLHIYLISPHGTRSTLLAQRPNDQAEQGFRNWPFMTVHSWGESPNGIWTLEVHNDGKPQNRAYLKEWTLILYGTSEDPNKHLDSGALTQAAMAQQAAGGSLPPPAQPKPTIVTSTLPPSVSELPAISTNPPAPLPAQGRYPSVELEPAPPSRPNSHWSFSSASTPPPPPPVSSGARPATTPASYVTSFKTIVISEAPMHHGPTQTVAPGPSRVPAPSPSAGTDDQTTKADFETVSPTTQAPASNRNVSITTTTTTSIPTTADGLQPASDAGITKPSVSQLDTVGSLPHQTVSGMNSKPNEPTQHPAVPQQPSTGGPSTNELDGNQIDLKLTKDYRSSGDQSIYSPTQLLNANDRLGHEPGPMGGKAAGGGGDLSPPGSGASTTLDQPLVSWGCSLLTLIMLIISNYQHHHPTNRLVRL